MDTGLKASEVVTTLAHFDPNKAIKATTIDAMGFQQHEASKRFISETGMGRLIIKT
jgi:hypothetical protein